MKPFAFVVMMVMLLGLASSMSVSSSTFFSLEPTYLPEQQVNPCELKGAVFVEKYRNYADYSIFIEEVEAFGKLKIFKEEAAIFATEAGYWYFTDQRGFADFTIYIEQTKGFENFTISFTDYRSSAGCN